MKPSKFHQPSELLTLLNSRHKQLGLGEDKPFRRPTKLDLDAVNAAVRDHAAAHPSDPWAGGRVRLHIMQGLELASEVTAAASHILRARELRVAALVMEDA